MLFMTFSEDFSDLPIFKNTDINELSFIFIPLMFFGLSILLFIGLILSVIHLAKRNKKSEKLAVIPLLMIITSVFLTFTPIISKTKKSINFNFKLDERNEVISMIKDGTIEVKSVVGFPDRIELPQQYKNLSKRGKIWVYKNDGLTEVFFITYIGFIDDFRGFIYRSDDNPPIKEEFNHFTQLVVIDEISDHWYYVVGT